MVVPKLAIVALVALFSLSGPPAQQDEITALKKDIETLKAQQAAMQRDLNAIKSFLQALAQNAATEALLNKTVALSSVPTRGAAAARVTMVEVSDYHCPFCRRYRQQTQPEIDKEYISTGKIRYAFIDYPIEQLHPDAFKAHEAANCAGDQGKYWEMNAQLFTKPTRDVKELVAQAESVGVNGATFRSCLENGKYAKPVRESVARMQELGIDSTPTFLIGLTPADGQPMKVLKVVKGSVPFADFKSAIDSVLQ
jgi:protein-disulfide isomerase